MNRSANLVKQSVLGVMLVIVSVYAGVQLGASLNKHQVIGAKLEQPAARIILVDGPLICPKC